MEGTFPLPRSLSSLLRAVDVHRVVQQHLCCSAASARGFCANVALVLSGGRHAYLVDCSGAPPRGLAAGAGAVAAWARGAGTHASPLALLLLAGAAFVVHAERLGASLSALCGGGALPLPVFCGAELAAPRCAVDEEEALWWAARLRAEMAVVAAALRGDGGGAGEEATAGRGGDGSETCGPFERGNAGGDALRIVDTGGGIGGVCLAGVLLGYPVVYEPSSGSGSGAASGACERETSRCDADADASLRGNCLGGIPLRVWQLRAAWRGSAAVTVGFSVPTGLCARADVDAAVSAWECAAVVLAEELQRNGGGEVTAEVVREERLLEQVAL